MPRRVLITCAILFTFAVPGEAESIRQRQHEHVAEKYIRSHRSTLVTAGNLEIDGRRMTCGAFPTILDPELTDFGAAPSGYLIINPDLFAGLPTAVKLWIFSHECAHQEVGADELKADCIAIQRGQRERWLDQSGLARVCEFMRPSQQDRTHFSGPQRCDLMRQCFQEGASRKDKRLPR